MAKSSNTISTEEPLKAARAMFDFAHETPAIPDEHKYRPFMRMRGWGSKHLFRGALDPIERILVANVSRIAKENLFRSFAIYPDNPDNNPEAEDHTVQGRAYFGHDSTDYIVCFQLWRFDSDYIVHGNRDFVGPSELALDPRTPVPDDEQSKRNRIIQNLKDQGARLWCQFCQKDFAVSECEFGTVSDTLVVFPCPVCARSNMHTVDSA